ncbi:replication initiation protein [Nocardioides luteus]|uniref:Replication initiation protein n=1 Tax=Nocardioides luteus TaxID=1844 RepID=A0ABQ5SXF6_9ACTN|nr:replication initiation protein [Nocardioides luteus]GLJ68273.1 replication initiation protein [Nocardioides luteus]
MVTISTLDAPGIHSDASSSTSGSFPGFGEDAPLDLSGLTDAGLQAVTARLIDKTFDAFAETAAAVKNCAHPVRLVGRSETYELDPATGEVGGLLSSFDSADAPLGLLYRACGNRRADVCPSCSRTYARDTFAMINAGLVGGKTVPDTVAENPLLFATFTAPSFGHVHGYRGGKPCRPRSRDIGERCPHGRPTACHQRHDEDDALNGAPLCFECYDWQSAVIWQYCLPQLWRYTTQALRRALARCLGVPDSRLGKVASLQFVKVAEYQVRGLVHFHALLRLDGPDGPGSAAPLDGLDLAQILQAAAAEIFVDAAPAYAGDPSRRLRWGKQLDIRVVRDGDRIEDPDSDLTPGQVAGYLAKYATKDANSVRADEPRPHLARLVEECRDLAESAAGHYGYGTDEKGKPLNPYHYLGKWAHMLGFRGHFSTKSRRYSITLGRLRRARARYQALVAASHTDEEARTQLLDLGQLESLLLADDEETTLVIGEWAYQGSGWTNPGDEALALAAAARAREYDQWKAQTKNTTNGKGK